METYFYRRGKKIPVQELDQVLAVRAESIQLEDPTPDLAGTITSLATNSRSRSGSEVSEAEVSAFHAAGWTFIQRQSGGSSRSAEPMAPPLLSGQIVEKVYLQENGHLLVSSRQLIVQLQADLSTTKVENELRKRDLEIIRTLAFAPNQFQVRVAPDADPVAVANELQESGLAVAAEPEFNEHIGHRLRPSDPTYTQQWHLNNTGGANGVAGADISAEDAWNFTLGKGVRVAVIDNGFDVTHPDLANAIVDQSGFFDGRDVFRQTLTNYPDPANIFGHGTFCAGMVGARHNNRQDGCGSAPECDLMLLAAQGDQVGTQTTLARAVAYAADPRLEVTGEDAQAGADVIVSSLGPNISTWALTTVLENAIIFAKQQGRRGLGTPIFWATSNGTNVDLADDEVVSHPEVIAVGRSDRNDRENDSARGEELDFLAPGVNVVSTDSGGGTTTDTGTSYAAPLAAGVGALILSINPGLRASEVRQIMRDTCDKVGGVTYDANGHNIDYGYGRVNAFRAVMRAMQSINTTALANTDIDGDGRAELPVVSSWGIGILDYRSNALRSSVRVRNGRRIDGWLLHTRDNRLAASGDFDQDGTAELLMTSPWGLGLMQRRRSTLTSLFIAPNGTNFGGWRLNTGDNIFGPVGDFKGDRKDACLVRSPWGMGLLELTTSSTAPTFRPLMIKPNGTRLGGWLLNTTDNALGPIGDFDGDGSDELLITSPWGLGMLKLTGDTMNSIVMAPNGTRLGEWLLDTTQNWFGPVGDFDGDGQDEVVIGSPWGIGILKLSAGTLTTLMLAPNGTSLGGWALNSFDNRIWGAADFNQDNKDELLITSPWGIGVLGLNTRTLTSILMAPNGSRFDGWLLDTASNQFKVRHNLTGARKGEIFVESPWGIGIMRQTANTFEVPFMRPNGTRLGNWRLNTAEDQVY